MWEARGVGTYSKTYPGMLGLKSISLPLIILVSETPIMLNSKFNSSNRWTWKFSRFRLMDQPIPAAPSPPPPNPGLIWGHLSALSVPGVGHLQILRYPLAGHLPIPGPLRAFDTHAVSYQNITTQRILLEKQADWLIFQGREKNEEVCKGMFSILCMHFFIAYQARIT